jgi:hypothetical protein
VGLVLLITSFVGIVVYLKCDTTETSSTLKAYSDLIITLTFSSSLNVLVGGTPPDGWRGVLDTTLCGKACQ